MTMPGLPKTPAALRIDVDEDGKITGRRCQCCGAVEFPPVLICNTCGSSCMEWTEISGKAKMKSIMMPGPASSEHENADLMPYCLAAVTIEEGADINSLVKGVTWENRDGLYAQLPVDVQAIIVQRDGYKTVMFELESLDNQEE